MEGQTIINISPIQSIKQRQQQLMYQQYFTINQIKK